MIAALAALAMLGGLHDARYCEIIEVKSDRAVVWNTIGLNTCPPARLRRVDPYLLAPKLGDTAIVINGPRHFLMDSASGRPGPVRSFAGLRARRVATIKDVTPLAPYSDRTITRSNTWRYRRGRTVYELGAPGGDRYVMQSYAQSVDPITSLHSLPTIGPRIGLPEGWRYRTRRLKRPLVLRPHGAATILRDAFENTYQLAFTTRRGPRADHAMDVTGHTRTTFGSAPGQVTDRGAVTGTPFGDGTIVLDGTLADGRLTATYRLTFPNGSVQGSVAMPFTISGGEIDFAGTTTLTGGTGAYRGITGQALQVHDHNTLDGQNGVLTVSGTVRY